MNNTKKLAIGLGLASGALLAAWLLTGDRRKKTTAFVKRNVKTFSGSLRKAEQKKAESPSATLYV